MNSTDKPTKVTIAISNRLWRSESMMRSKLEKIRQRLVRHIGDMQREVEEIQAAEEVRYSGWVALFKVIPSGGFECVAIVNENAVPDDLTEDWNVSMPIPEPGSIPEFEGW